MPFATVNPCFFRNGNDVDDSQLAPSPSGHRVTKVKPPSGVSREVKWLTEPPVWAIGEAAAETDAVLMVHLVSSLAVTIVFYTAATRGSLVARGRELLARRR